MTKIFITGGTGYLGGFLVKELVKRKHKVVALVRKTSATKNLRHKNIELVYGDLNNIESLDKATKDIDIVIHLASLVSQVNVNEKEYYKINVEGSKNVFMAACKNKVKQFIHCSSEAVYGNTKDPQKIIDEKSPCENQMTIYGKTKYLGEKAIRQLAENNEIYLTIVRPSRIYGEGDKSFVAMCKLLDKGLFFNIGSGKAIMQPIYITDCAEAIADCINNKKAFGKTYILAGNENVTKKQFLSILASNLGTKLPMITVPAFLIILLAVINEFLFKLIKKEPFISRRKLAFFLRSNRYDISASQRDLNFRPKVNIEQGIKKMIGWYKKNGLI